jgi:hypothetical protein
LGKVSGPDGALKVKGVKSRLMGLVVGVVLRLGTRYQTEPRILWKTARMLISWVTSPLSPRT